MRTMTLLTLAVGQIGLAAAPQEESLLLTVVSAGNNSADALTPEDHERLTAVFDDIARRWHQPSVDQANTILTRPQYTAADWEAWFENYFNVTRHPLTDDLWNYLNYPAFSWFDDATHAKLQEALCDPLWKKATDAVVQNKARLGDALYRDADLRQSVFNSHRFFAVLARSGKVNDARRDDIYRRYRAHVTALPQFFSDAASIDPVAQPMVGILRAQVWTSFCDTLPLTPTRKTEIAQAIGLGRITKRKLSIWNRHGILIMDNNGLSDAQLAEDDALLGAIPAGLTNLRFVTVRQFLEYPYLGLPIVLKGQTGNLVNYYLSVSEGRVFFGFDGAAGSWPGPSSPSTIPWDVWNHVAGTYDGTTIRVYVNGKEATSLRATGVPVTASTEPLRIGHMPDFSMWMRGCVDEVKLYSRALSADEMMAEAQLKPVSTTRLVASWSMNETRGTIVADSSGHRHHGLANGTAPAAGRVKGALFFDGQSRSIVVNDAPDLRIGGPMTVSAWVKIANEWPFLHPGTSGMVNTFGCSVAEPLENPFPDDVERRQVPVFCAGNLHEFNHVVDAHAVWPRPALKARETQLIAQAGRQPLQYLRSMVVKGDGSSIFPDAPQEFFASISNAYFADSWHTLDLALARFDRGYKEPLNQFLFFAEVYSQGGATTKVYKTHSSGQIAVSEAATKRDPQGRLVGLTRGPVTYRFVLDAAGNTVSWSK